jgi:hypothetical protein
MPVWQHCLRRAAKRTLELIVLQFLVVVILPDNAVGTPDLPAVGAKKVACSADSSSVAPSHGEPAAPLDLFVFDLATCVGDLSLVESRPAASCAASVLQLSRRLRI